MKEFFSFFRTRNSNWVATVYASLLLLILLVGIPLAHAQTTPGAPVPFTEFNAATSAGVQTNGTVIGPNYNFGTLASEATGRQAVELAGLGKYVSFTLTAPANAITIHYAIPDAISGGGLTEPLSLYANGSFVTSLSLTSAYSWLYGAYTFSKTPSIGMPGFLAPHDFYNDVRYLFPSTLPQGTVVKLQVDAGDNSPWYVINTADFEVVPAPLSAPANSINVTQAPYNADNSGLSDSTTAIQNAIWAAAGSNQIVYLPAGTYTISNPLYVSNVTVEGAGEWYTVITGTHVEFAGQISPASSNVNISNLAIFGNVAIRDDGDGSVTGFNGGFSNSTISNVWIQNTKVGAWIVGPATNLTFNNLRIMDLKADGINFDATNGAVTNSTIENTFFRNTQDDGIALWSQNGADTNITLNQNTVNSPGLANNIAVYGSGNGVQVTNNLLQDTVTRGGGIHVGQRFSSVPMSGTLTISNNKLVRAGQFDPGFFFGVGAIWFWPYEGNLNSTVNLSGNVIQDSPYPAIQFLGPNATTNVTIGNTTITNAGTFAFAEQGAGAATVSNTTATGVLAGIFNQTCNSGFAITDGGGNSGMASSTCIYPSPASLWVYPDILTFQNATVNQASSALQVAVINKAEEIATLGTISASSGFTVKQDPSYPCGSTLAAANYGGANESGWCLVDVVFTPQASGITMGTLTIPSSEPGSPTIVQLVGSTGGNTLNTPPTVTPTSLSFGNQLVGTTSTAQSVTLSNQGTSTVQIGSITISSGFSQTNTCGSTLTAGASCSFSVSFAPTAAGTLNGSLGIATSATAMPITVTLSGTGSVPPTVPTGLTAGPAGSGAVTVSWTASTGTAPITYNVYRGTTSGGESSTPVATGIGTSSYTDTGLSSGTTYYYEVSATNAVATSLKSTEVSASPVSALLQINAGGGAVAPFVADEYFSTGTEFSTSSAVGTAGVGNPAPQAVYQSVRWAPSFTYTIPGLTAGSNYTVRLHFAELTWSAAGQRVFNVAINGTSVLSNFDIFATAGGQLKALIEQFNTTANSSGQIIISFTAGSADNPEVSGIEILGSGSVTPPSAPSVPAGLTATAGNGAVSLTWAASTGTAPITYNVYRGTVSNAESATPIASNLTSASYTDTAVTNSTKYYYEVSATNSVATSAKSAEVNATPVNSGNPPSIPSGLTAIAGNGTVSLSWTASTGSTPITYSVFRGTASGGESTTPVVANLTTASYIDTGLSNGTTYYYEITATNSIATTVKSAEVLATPANVSTLLQIDAGGAAVGTFVADEFYSTGNQFSSTSSVSTSGVTNAAPAAVYQSVRWSPSFSYTIPGLVAGANYTVRLHFAELTWTASGQRIFNVAINGTTVLSNFDIFATAGGQLKALVEQFNTTANNSGQIVISFTAGSADNPEVAGIELLGASGSYTPPVSPVVQINSGSSSAASSWVADEYFNTGNEFSSSASIDTSHAANPAPAAVYQTCRWAPSFTYTIPGLMAGKTYGVRLHFAELSWTSTGQRVFNVAINGTSVLSNFDVFAVAGAQNRAITEQFNAVASSTGTITVAFSQGSADNPEVEGIEILP